MEELKQDLMKRNYPFLLINDGIEKAMEKDIKELRQVKEKLNQNQIIPFVSTFNPQNPELFSVIKQNEHILEESDTMKSILEKTPFLKSKRQAWNLQRILTRARFDKQASETIVKKCNRGNCGLCKHLLEGKNFEFVNGKTFTVNASMSCDVKNVVYVITCRGCNENYIGETVNLRHRTTVHNQQTRDPSTRMIPLSAHIDNCSDKDPKYYIFPFYKVKTMDAAVRKMKESYLIDVF